MSTLIILSALMLLRLHQIHRANADSTCPKNCRPYEVEIHCNKTTGECSEGCKTGFYGLTCDKTCRCGGGACAVTDGTCMITTSVKPEPVSPGHQTQDCRTHGYIAGICVLGAVVVILIVAVAIMIVKLRRFSKRSNRPQTNRPEDQHPLTENSQTEPPIALHQSEKEQLVHDLGVHILCDENKRRQPVLLYCALMKFDHKRVNGEKARLNRDYLLFNEPASSERESPERFKMFWGTTTIAPVVPVDSPSYWEVNTHVHLNNKLEEADLLLSIGLCSETQRDKYHQVRLDYHCFNLNVGVFDGRICTKIYRERDEKRIKYETILDNNMGESSYLHYGVLVYRGIGAILYFDIEKMKSLVCLDNVDFRMIDLEEGPLWPMFGVYNGEKAKVKMDLKTGGDVDMTPEKKKMILSAIPRAIY